MEEWEFELEFLTWDAHERALAKARTGVDRRVEETEVDPEEFKAQLEEFHKNTNTEFNPSEWEVIDG